MMQCFPVACKNSATLSPKSSKGFTLIEVLVGSIIFALAVAATFALFNLALGAIRKTETQSTANAAIDADISVIKQMAEQYNACTVQTGSFDACNGQILGDSWYYYPSGSDGAFRNACSAGVGEVHITDALISAINNPAIRPQPTGGVVRQAAVREDSSDSKNHLILIRYVQSSRNIDRVVKILPVVSAWCP
jgi:prepilin-type N-terminal cleavage/methylation domain-containing protein